MICVSLAEPSFRSTAAALGLKGLPMAGIRLDLPPLGPAEIAAIFSRSIPLIATFRPGRVSAADRAAALEAAILAGAAYVDIEHDAAPDRRRRLVRTARDRGCRVILSVHSGRASPRSFPSRTRPSSGWAWMTRPFSRRSRPSSGPSSAAFAASRSRPTP